MELTLRKPRLDLFRLTFLASLVLLGISFLGFFLLQGTETGSIFLDVLSPIVDLLAAFLLLYAAITTAAQSKRLSIAWGVIALGTFFYALADASWAVLELVIKIEPFPSIADGFYLAYYPVFLVGVFLMQEKADDRRVWANKVIDIGIVILASFLGFWNFLIGPIIQSNIGLPGPEQAILVAYPVGDLVLFFALLLMIYNHSRQQDGRSLFLLAGSLLAVIITDAVYSYQTLLGIYSSGSIVDIGWVVSMLLSGLAGASQAVTVRSKRLSRSMPVIDRLLAWLRTYAPYLPYLWLVAAFVLLIYSGFVKLPMGFTGLSLTVGSIITLVLVRQVITLLENQDLNDRLRTTNRELEDEIAERERIEVQLSFDSLHDALTGLPNRTLFLDRLRQAIEFAKRGAVSKFAILFIDLDKFKVVNDSLGHLMGDQLLILVARKLAETLRSCDTIARFGGDEFEILLDISPQEKSVRLVVDKVLKAIQTPVRLEGHEVYVNGSVGIVMDLSGYTRAEDALRDADIAMYHAKGSGGGRYSFFNLQMRQNAYVRLEMENELRVGLKNSEFRLYYQPIYQLKERQLVGFEALIRWFHPDRGLLLPADFLPVAEETGLILPIGDWVLETACRQLNGWQAKYPFLDSACVNVNISGVQIAGDDFFQKVDGLLNKVSLPPGGLRLEITENTLINNYAVFGELFTKFQQIGVRLFIDDFGTGYSALGYLQHLPIDAIKIDRSFVSETARNPRGIKLVRGIISMAHELGLETIAEGIETDEQFSLLQSLDCRYGQGFLLCKPLEPEAVEALIASREALRASS